jgi:8-oxo-dGTP pyrophosphatase MutT (NUDIX family)
MLPTDHLRSVLPGLLDPAPLAVPPPGTVLAGVLVPVLARTDQPRLVFTRRSEAMSRHAGEISFPGGLCDPDEPLAATALREAQEELGLVPSEIELAGALPSVHTHVTGVLIVPFVGFLARDPQYTPNRAEIADVLEYPLSALADAGEERDFEWEGRRFRTFVYDMDGAMIWGATARILWSLIDVLESASGPPGRAAATGRD